MSKRRNDDLFHTLSETHLLVGNMEVPSGEEFSLESILAEFGQGEAEPAPKTESEPVQEAKKPPEPEEIAETAAEQVTEETPPKKTAVRRRKVLQFPHRKTVEQPQATEQEPEAARAEEEPAASEPVQAEAEVAAPAPIPTLTPDALQERLSIEDVMAQTVDSVLEDESDGILEEKSSLKERIGPLWDGLKEKGNRLIAQFVPAQKLPFGRVDTAVPEPDMEKAARDVKRRCKRLGRQLLLSAIPMGLLVVLTALDARWGENLPTVWHETVLLRCGVVGGLLLATCLLAVGVWRETLREMKAFRLSCGAAAALLVLAVLCECGYGAATNRLEYLPMAAPAAVLVWLCLLGQLLLNRAKSEAFRLADLGGRPPYSVSVTAVGACKQGGRLEGFYNTFSASDPSSISQQILLPLLLSSCTVLAGIVCIGGERMDEFFRVWSAMLSATLSLGLPLCGALSVYCLNRRLSRSGCAVAGYAGARALNDSRRMVLTDSDVFPPGTISLNGLKIYGEEIGKVVSYAATAIRASGSQLLPLFEQLLAAEGGSYRAYEDLHFYEEGGVGITIRGESVTVGSEYFMRKRKVRLPQELKVKTGVYLAVDGQLIAIFAIKYQASRNVEWALRALRRNRIAAVLATRSGNITPGLLKKRFGVDVKPIYPDVSTRLALSDASREMASQSNAILYREGLMPFAETVIGSRRCCRAVRRSTVFCWLGSFCGLLFGYYLADVAAYGALNAAYVLVFGLLWLLPVVLMGDLTRRY